MRFPPVVEQPLILPPTQRFIQHLLMNEKEKNIFFSHIAELVNSLGNDNPEAGSGVYDKSPHDVLKLGCSDINQCTVHHDRLAIRDYRICHEKDKKISSDSLQNPAANIFQSLRLLFVVGGPHCGKARVEVLKKKVLEKGAELMETFSENNIPTHIVTGVKYDQLLKLLHKKCNISIKRIDKILNCEDLKVVNPEWISESLIAGYLLHEYSFLITIYQMVVHQSIEEPSDLQIVKYKHLSDNKLAKQQHIYENQNQDIICLHAQKIDEKSMGKILEDVRGNQQTFASQNSESTHINYNKQVTDELDRLADIYNNTGDQWRALAYKKASCALKKHPRKIESGEEAGNLKGVGSKTAEKIEELLRYGSISKLNQLEQDQSVKTIRLFCGIFGVGPKTAQNWYMQGFRSLEDVQKNAKLSQQQIIGIKYYEDFQQRIPRCEVVEIESYVRSAALRINPSLHIECCGSFRREKQDSGDVDILITDTMTSEPCHILETLLVVLHQEQFLTDDLSVSLKLGQGDSDNYMGVCRIPDHNKYKYHRRIDIKVYKKVHYPFALLYFTGSDHFNRYMRWHAHCKGLCLSDKSLTRVIRVSNKKVHECEQITGMNEEKDIFDYLGLEYKKPHERNI